MLGRIVLLVVASAPLVACSVSIDFGSSYKCPDGVTCPDGYQCVETMCVENGMAADAGTDAMSDAGGSSLRRSKADRRELQW